MIVERKEEHSVIHLSHYTLSSLAGSRLFDSSVYSIYYCPFIHICIFFCLCCPQCFVRFFVVSLVMISVFSIPPQPQNTTRPSSSLLFLPRNYRILLVILSVMFSLSFLFCHGRGCYCCCCCCVCVGNCRQGTR